MSDTHELRQRFAEDIRAVLTDRLGAASVVEALSTKDDMTLNLVQEADGRQFVVRTYQSGAEKEFSYGLYTPELGFEDGLAAMTDMYSQVGLRVVSSSVLPKLEGRPTTVLSEYIPGLLPATRASLEAKKEAVKGLAKLLDPTVPYLPGAGGLAVDMFMYMTDTDGSQHPIVVDNEPRLVVKDAFRGNQTWIDSTKAEFINGISVRIEAGWSNNHDEMASLARAFFAGLNTIHDESIHEGENTLEAIMSMHALTQPELMQIRKSLGR